MTGRALYDPRAALQAWRDVGKGLVYGIQHPLEFGKQMLDWDDLSSGHIARWLGNMSTAVLGTIGSGGASEAADAGRGASRLSALRMLSIQLSFLSLHLTLKLR